jgi:predicted  nucleic acid-binding Zn-ribbon protein
MRIFLKILVAVLLLLSIVALMFGSMLFKKRELLKGRTQKLEQALRTLSASIESEIKPAAETAEFPPRDISPCTAEILEKPERSEFWKKYDIKLEGGDATPFNLQNRLDELRHYYKIDPATGKNALDPNSGFPITTGPGTMQGLLDEIVAKAGEQYNHLTEARLALKAVRTELVDAITDLNTKKGELRTALKGIKDLEAQIESLKKDIENLNQKIKEEQEAKKSLEDRIAEQQNQINRMAEEKQDQEATIEQIKKELANCMKGREEGAQPKRPVTVAGVAPVAGGAAPVVVQVNVQPGPKGKVVAVNANWNFCIIDLSDEFLKELLGEKLDGPAPAIDLMLKRPGQPETFVTKVRLVQVRKNEKLAIVDILRDWQQTPVNEGDVVFF